MDFLKCLPSSSNANDSTKSITEDCSTSGGSCCSFCVSPDSIMSTDFKINTIILLFDRESHFSSIISRIARFPENRTLSEVGCHFEFQFSAKF